MEKKTMKGTFGDQCLFWYNVIHPRKAQEPFEIEVTERVCCKGLKEGSKKWIFWMYVG